MARRVLLLGLAALTLLAAYAGVFAGAGEALLAVPFLLMVIPLVAGRYLGQDTLVRWAARLAARRRRPVAAGLLPHARRRALGIVGRGRLLAGSHALRGPPAPAL